MSEYIEFARVKSGDKLRADGGFTCIAAEAVLTVATDADGNLFVPCCEGSHLLDGQLDDNGRLIGLRAIPPAKQDCRPE